MLCRLGCRGGVHLRDTRRWHSSWAWPHASPLTWRCGTRSRSPCHSAWPAPQKPASPGHRHPGAAAGQCVQQHVSTSGADVTRCSLPCQGRRALARPQVCGACMSSQRLEPPSPDERQTPEIADQGGWARPTCAGQACSSLRPPPSTSVLSCRFSG